MMTPATIAAGLHASIDEALKLFSDADERRNASTMMSYSITWASTERHGSDSVAVWHVGSRQVRRVANDTMPNAQLSDDGVLVEGTCDELGRRSTWVALDPTGPRTLTFAARLEDLGLAGRGEAAARVRPELSSMICA
mgnify:CR=1 FL=1